MLKKLRRASTVKLGYTVDVHFRQASIANSVAPNADGLSFVREGRRSSLVLDHATYVTL